MLKDYLRFEYVIYPLWRRQFPAALRPLRDAVMGRFFPVDVDRKPPRDTHEMADYLVNWGVFPLTVAEVTERIKASKAHKVPVDRTASPLQHDGSPVRIPAQWETTETVLQSWGVIYPPIWEMHAQMAEAISQVAIVEILVPSAIWADAIYAYLDWRACTKLDNVRFLILPTNDIWIRDYGPIMGLTADGTRVALNPTYAVLPQYPQGDDNGMTEHWAAHHDIAIQPFDLFTEGGNWWSDGAGTLIMSSQIFYSNRYYDRSAIEEYLHQRVEFDKLIITPRLTLEETGHVDLLVKLASADTVLVSSANSMSTAQALAKTRRVFERETNAAGLPYRILELPTPHLYWNWFLYTIRRGYTNSLTVNGRVLVPTFGIAEDQIALKVYEEALPDYEIIPIDSRSGINGGGAVHCMTKEIPAG